MNAIIIEDEKLVAKELMMKIAEIDASIKITTVIPSVKYALKWFNENTEPDVIFADIQLGDGVSFQIFEQLTISCPIIFTTSYNEYAIKAFKVNGIDYLLKPVEPEELEKAIAKAKNLNSFTNKLPFDYNSLAQMLQTGSNRMPYKEYFLCNFRNSLVPIKSEEIMYFKYDVLIYAFTISNEKHNISCESMDEIEDMLNPHIFFRINRQFIVARSAVQKIWGIENSKIVVKLKVPYQTIEIDISRQKAPIFKKWMER